MSELSDQSPAPSGSPDRHILPLNYGLDHFAKQWRWVRLNEPLIFVWETAYLQTQRNQRFWRIVGGAKIANSGTGMRGEVCKLFLFFFFRSCSLSSSFTMIPTAHDVYSYIYMFIRWPKILLYEPCLNPYSIRNNDDLQSYLESAKRSLIWIHPNYWFERKIDLIDQCPCLRTVA